jgi:hypothetical protein
MNVVNAVRVCDTRTSIEYCPVISVGGSYPGWLSATARLLYPDLIDIGYAASASELHKRTTELVDHQAEHDQRRVYQHRYQMDQS